MPKAEDRPQKSDFNRAFGDAKNNAAGAAEEVSGAARDVYEQARDSTNQAANAAARATQDSAGSFEQAVRNTIENQPYRAVAIALGIGWLLGRMRRPI
jgi:ElaB/YqjD/DUF883 family membrane-anchored ribosome-binding protein